MWGFFRLGRHLASLMDRTPTGQAQQDRRRDKTGIEPSFGSVSDSQDSALAGAIKHYGARAAPLGDGPPLHLQGRGHLPSWLVARGSWRSCEAAEYVTLGREGVQQPPSSQANQKHTVCASRG